MSKALSPSQEKLLAALLTCTTIRAAATTAGISERSARTYMKDATFSKAYTQARQSLLEETRNGITALMTLSLQGLENILRDEETPPNVRLKAIEMVQARVLNASIADPAADAGTKAGMIDHELLSFMTNEEVDAIQQMLDQAKQRKHDQSAKQGAA